MFKPNDRQKIFDTLNTTTQRPTPPQLSLFAPVAPAPVKNMNEFWYGSVLLKIAGREISFPTVKTLRDFVDFDPVIESFKHVVETEHRHTIGYKNFNKDYKLSRFACWNLLNKEEYDPFFATYFMMPNAKFHEIEKIADDFLRIRFRDYVRIEMDQLNGMIKKSGGIHEVVKNSFYQDLFNIKYSTYEIKSAYGIPTGTPILDHMGLYALQTTYEILNRVKERFKKAEKPQQNTIISLLNEETINARINIEKQNGVLPERNIEHDCTQIVARKLKNLTNTFIREYKNKTLR